MLYRTVVNEVPITIFASKTETAWQVEIYTNSKSVFNEKISLESLHESNPARDFCTKNEINEAWVKFLESNTDSIGAITASVSSVIAYDHQFSMDIFIGKDVFRCEKDGFINPKPFMIWYLGTKHRIPRIEQIEWKEFVSTMLSMASESKQDPLVPDLLNILISTMRAGNMHSEFCDTLANMVYVRGDSAWFVYRREEDQTLYVPSHVMDAIRKKTEMGKKAFRNYFIPYLLDIKDNRRRIGTTVEYEKRPQIRFWAFDMQKIVEGDSGVIDAIKNMIDCEEENEERSEINVTAE